MIHYYLLNTFERPNIRSNYEGRAYVDDEGGEGEPDGEQGQGGERAVNPQA